MCEKDNDYGDCTGWNKKSGENWNILEYFRIFIVTEM